MAVRRQYGGAAASVLPCNLVCAQVKRNLLYAPRCGTRCCAWVCRPSVPLQSSGDALAACSRSRACSCRVSARPAMPFKIPTPLTAATEKRAAEGASAPASKKVKVPADADLVALESAAKKPTARRFPPVAPLNICVTPLARLAPRALVHMPPLYIRLPRSTRSPTKLQTCGRNSTGSQERHCGSCRWSTAQDLVCFFRFVTA